ncbi:FAD-binding oxidoreductase [Saccharothrix texasensis]|uniref:Decaprenylphospho-beta-D-ribofuranose 2-oxidase n=1 Tax=Saccharothrix texasensis TaxID=103734 RepID=A0A3N1H2V7_9PSEU|nr:FAD-binding oxidoreductase [Saccharothrix texasensis]ROP36873.1 decaprenylphospho-beta-D-ribofuranose 2-oxidase [Saccharothrix texasensis]
MLTRLSGWGRTSPTVARVVSPRDVETLANVLEQSRERGVIARGLGRSYGDPAQNAGGVVLDMTRFDRIRRVEVDDGLVDVEAGVSLDALVRALLPLGLWPPVLPGTRQVTVGGAIAADVHGKGHHVVGSFGDHVRSLDLLTADGSVRTLTPDGDGSALFWATVGGMGLTGVVLRATLRVVPVETSYFVVDTERAGDLDDLLARQSADDDRYAESVSWFDATATGSRLGRGVLTRANHARLDDLPAKLRRDPLAFDAPRLFTVPDVLPSGLLNRATGRAFSELWYRRSPTRHGQVQNITEFLHPLDVVGEWNRGYGPRGFIQYQFAVPFAAVDVIRRAVRRIASSGHVSALNVLKRFGPGNRAPLSFPAPGWTLCVDLPVRPGLGELCDELDELVLDAGGRHYLAKESRTTAEAVRRGYPRFAEWRAVRASVDPDGVFASDMSRRLEL